VIRIEFRSHMGCPNADEARRVLDDCMASLDLPDTVIERVGDYPSPTILIDGVDVMTGDTEAPRGHACRLDVPTREQLTAALTERIVAQRRDGAPRLPGTPPAPNIEEPFPPSSA
jgi:hypothetical protein